MNWQTQKINDMKKYLIARFKNDKDTDVKPTDKLNPNINNKGRVALYHSFCNTNR